MRAQCPPSGVYIDLRETHRIDGVRIVNYMDSAPMLNQIGVKRVRIHVTQTDPTAAYNTNVTDDTLAFDGEVPNGTKPPTTAPPRPRRWCTRTVPRTSRTCCQIFERAAWAPAGRERCSHPRGFVVLDVVTNWGYVSRLGLRRVEIFAAQP